MKTIISLNIILFGFFFTLSLHSQNYEVKYRICANCTELETNDNASTNYSYGALNTFQTNQFYSDFGPRKFGADGYDWHGGSDYSSQGGDADRGDLLAAILGGNVILQVDNSFKYIIINNESIDFGYGHLFRDEVVNSELSVMISGECALKKMMEPNENHTALIVPLFDNINNVIGHTAFGNVSGYVYWNNKKITVNTSIETGQIVGPTGDSGGNYSAHLHLYTFANNNFSTHDQFTKNPLEFISHDAPDYDVQILGQYNIPGFNQIYPGSNTSSIRVRAQMPNEDNGVSYYQESIYNVDKVEFLVKKSFQNETGFTQIQGPTYIGNVSLGGRTNSERNPFAMYVDGSTQNGGPAHIGNWTKTGIDPYTYADAASHPYDDFYFADFATRIHKNDELGNPKVFASCPQEARYNDGNYDLKAKVITVKDVVHESEVYSFTIDNFKPFIQHVKMEVGGLKIYDSEWMCNDCGGISLSNEPTLLLNQDVLAQSGMVIQVDVSEPLNFLNLDIPYFGLSSLTGNSFNGQSFSFETGPVNNINELASKALIFDGQDLNGNSLLNLFDYTTDECVVLATRGDDGWENDNIPSGFDQLHFIPELSDNPCPGITIEDPVISPPSYCGSSDASITFLEQPIGGAPPYIGEWLDEEGNTILISGSDWMTISNLTEGSYYLRIFDSNGCQNEFNYIITSNLSLQNDGFSWVGQIGGTDWDEAESMVVDSEGNVYTIGWYSSTMDFDPGEGISLLTANNEPNIFILKLNAFGEFVWVKQISVGDLDYNSTLNIDIDNYSNIYITGSFLGSFDFDPGNGNNYLTQSDQENIFILKLNTLGDFIWVKSVEAPAVFSFDIDNADNLYMVGTFSGTIDFDPGPSTYFLSSNSWKEGYILKLDAFGNFLWVKKMETKAFSIVIDGENNIFLSGTISGTTDLDPSPENYYLTSTIGQINNYLLKLDESGNFLWAKVLEGNANAKNRSIQVDHQNNIYMVGEFYGTIDFDPNQGTFYLTSDEWKNTYLLKLDESGNFVWAKILEGDWSLGWSIGIDNDNNVFVVGNFYETIDFDPGPENYYQTAIGIRDAFILKLDESGNFGWVKFITGEGFQDCTKIAIDFDNNKYLLGEFSDMADFDPSSENYYQTSAGSNDIYILRLNQLTVCSLSPVINCPESLEVTIGLNDCVPSDSDCFTSHGYSGCDNNDCQAIVCSMDPWCCDVTWDGICVSEALEYCTPCDGTGNEDCGTIVNFNVSVDDDCPGVTLEMSASSGDYFPVGTTTVNCIATDADCNITECSFTITVKDNNYPVAICKNGTVKLNEEGGGSITVGDLDGGSADECGEIDISLTQYSFDCNDLGTNLVTLTVTDLGGNSISCTSEVEVVDPIAPVVYCNDATVFLDPEGTVSLSSNEVLEESIENCGIISYELSSSNFSCDDLGTNYVTLTATDYSGNIGTCTSVVTVQTTTDLPEPWTHSDIDQANGDAVYNPCNQTFTINSSGNSTLYIDEQHFAHQEICGNATIIAHIESIENAGWAGIEIRETLDPWSKMVSLRSRLSPIIQRVYRPISGQKANIKQLIRFGHSWLKLVRTGDSFSGYSSNNGVNWTNAFTVSIPMDNCVFVGLFTESNSVNSVTTASFDNISISGNNSNGFNEAIQPSTLEISDTAFKNDLTLFPNPTDGLLNVVFKQPIQEPVSITIFDSNGKLLYEEKHSFESKVIQLNLERMNIPSGIYLLNIRTTDGVLSGRFVKD